MKSFFYHVFAMEDSQVQQVFLMKEALRLGVRHFLLIHSPLQSFDRAELPSASSSRISGSDKCFLLLTALDS